MSRSCQQLLLAALPVLLLLGACVRFPEPNTDLPQPQPPMTHAAPEAAPAQSGAIHRVQRGDTVYALAERYRVPVRSLIDANRLRPPYVLVPGQPLLIPKPREHQVARGETVYGISRRYGVDMSALVNLNGVVPPYTIKVGQVLRIPAPIETEGQTEVAAAAPALPPSAVPAQPPVAAAPVPPAPAPIPGGKSGVQMEELPPAGGAPSSPPLVAAAPAPQPAPPAPILPPPGSVLPGSKPGAAAAAPAAVPALGAIPEPPPRGSGRFLWPVQGKIVSSFGPKKGGLHNDGINIQAPRGTSVRAAENGVVAYAGNELRGFGNLLLIKHADGWTSAYAHNEELLVRRGDKVARGQVIAKVGTSGTVSTPQLHFELRQGKRAVDPVKLLGQAQAGL